MTESGRPELLSIEHFDGRPSSTQLCRQKNKPQTLSDLRLVENESAGVRTLDLRIKSPLLYQLSYALKLLHKNTLRQLRQ